MSEYVNVVGLYHDSQAGHRVAYVPQAREQGQLGRPASLFHSCLELLESRLMGPDENLSVLLFPRMLYFPADVNLSTLQKITSSYHFVIPNPLDSNRARFYALCRLHMSARIGNCIPPQHEFITTTGSSLGWECNGRSYRSPECR